MREGNSDCRQTRTILLSFILIFLAGCEAALQLDAVSEEHTKSSLRTDQYQKIVATDGVITLVGSHGVVLTSRDEGERWVRQQVSTAPNFIDATSCTDGRLLALSFERQLWSSSDQGESWHPHPLPTTEDMVSVACSPDGSWWVVGSFTTLLSSTDQGRSWRQQSLDEDALLTHISFFSAEEAIASAEFGLFFKTTDGGREWQLIGHVGQELYPLAVHFSDPKQGWIGGLSGVIMHTRDGGQSWQAQASGINAPIYSFFGRAGQLYASGDHGNVLRYRDGRWEQLETPNHPVYISTGQVLSDQQILVAGGSGLLLKLSPQSAPL